MLFTATNLMRSNLMKLLLPGVKSRSCGFKRRMPALLLVLLATLLNHAAHAQILTYENDGIVNAPPDIPPNIDAINFVNANQGQFIINFTNDLLPGEFYGFGMDPYTWQNTQTYSNLFGALMACNTGFRFDTFDPVQGRTRAANTFFNAGTIECGTPDTLSFFELDSAFHSNTTYFVDFSLEGAICTINAKNI